MEEDPFIQNFLKIRLGGRYQICKRLGSGSFGDVYIGMQSCWANRESSDVDLG